MFFYGIMLWIWWGETPDMIKHFGSTIVHDKMVYKCFIHSLSLVYSNIHVFVFSLAWSLYIKWNRRHICTCVSESESDCISLVIFWVALASCCAMVAVSMAIGLATEQRGNAQSALCRRVICHKILNSPNCIWFNNPSFQPKVWQSSGPRFKAIQFFGSLLVSVCVDMFMFVVLFF